MGKNVTFTGADDGSVAVDLDGKVFAVNQTVSDVSEQDVERLEALDGHHFKVEPAQPADTKTKTKTKS